MSLKPLECRGPHADAGLVFFTRSEELKQSRFVPLVLDAMADLGGSPTRPEVVARAIELGRFTNEELAFPSHRQQDRAKGRSAVQGTLRYAIWYARSRGDLLDGDTGGQQVLTDQGRAKIGAATGYPELDARRAMPRGAGAPPVPAVLRPYASPRTEQAETASLGDALPRTGVYDMDALERKTRAHHQLQRETEQWLTSLGWTTGLSPDGRILTDLMAEQDGRWLVVEIKTLDEDRPALARQQLRLGLGQVLDYRERLRAIYADTDAIVVLDHAPVEPLWTEIMRSCGVGLAWAPFGDVAEAALEAIERPEPDED